MSTVSQDSWLGTPIALNKDFVKLDIHKALIKAKVLSESTCQIKIVMNADPHIDYIPQSLFNWGLKNIFGVFLKYLVSKAEKLPDEYKKLMEDKKEFYEELERRIA